MIDMTDRAYVDMWFGSLKDLLRHIAFLPKELNNSSPQPDLN
jgi:hypothetical protein